MIHNICEEINEGKNVRENLIQLNQLIKTDKDMDVFLDEYYEYETCFIGLLDDEDAKVRKNIVKLLGKVGDPVLLKPLFEHYQAENTQFLKADYLAAMASFEYETYLPQLKERRETLEGQERTKHSIEEMKQLQKLIWKLEPPKKHTFYKKDRNENILLIIPRGHEAAVMEEIQKIPDTEGKAIAGGCLVKTGHLDMVAKIRTYQAILFDFYPKTIHSFDGADIGKEIMESGLVDFIQKRHKESHAFLFRVDIKGVKDMTKKNQMARTLSLYVEEHSDGRMINEPSMYEVEIRVIAGAKGVRVFLKLSAMKDERFMYRKYAMATSMQPAKAALMMHYLKPYMKEDGNILDPFCGTGTLLIERAFAGTYKSLYGLDISGQAVQAAWENSQRAKKVLNLVQRNFNDFKHEYTFDEIITDMPRQSAHMKYKQLEYLYQLLFVRSRELMAEKAVMAVYCEDAQMMERCLNENKWLTRVKKIPMSKDQTSWLYILRKLYN